MQQQFEYVAIGKQGYPTIRMNEQEAFISNYVYKKVQCDFTLENTQRQQKTYDNDFEPSTNNLSQIDNKQFQWLDLSQITTGDLFQQLSYSQVEQKFQNNYNFLKQLRLFPIDYYKTLFATLIVNNQSFYKIILNVNGVFRYVYLDGRVPVAVNQKCSIFGIKFSHPWKILLVKAYAKVIGGYQHLRSQQPYSFIKLITFNNWRIKSLNTLDRQTHLQFLQHKLHGDITPNYLQQSNNNIGVITVASKVQESLVYQTFKNDSRPVELLPYSNVNKQNIHQSHYLTAPTEALICSTHHSFTIISKTKNNSKILQTGLLPHSSCYRITNLFKINNDDVVKVESSTKSRWNGKHSIYDESLYKYYSEKNHRLNLERNFIMSLNDSRQLFSNAIVSPIDYQLSIESVSTCQVVNLTENSKGGQYFEFEIVKPGKYDFSIIQPESNMIDHNEEIHSFSALKPIKKVYPRVKMLMGRRNQIQTQRSSEAQNIWTCVDASFSSNPSPVLTYFQNLVPGRYMLRVNFQSSPKPLSYNINIVSDSPVKLYWVDPPRMQRSLFQRSCMLTLAQQKGDVYYLDSQTCQEWVSYGNAYNDIGYGFIAFCSELRSPYKLYCEIDTDILEKEGFKLKYPYNDKGRHIGMFVEAGGSKVLILKREGEPEMWPPSSIKFFKVQV